MNKNEMFHKYLEDPIVKKETNLNQEIFDSLDLSSESGDLLIETIKSMVMTIDVSESVSARRVVQALEAKIR